MARNQERQFSESESLRAQDLGEAPREAEERRPLFTAPSASDAAREGEPAGETPLRQGKREEAALPEAKEEAAPPPAGIDAAPPAPVENPQAKDAWAREAKRVESAQDRRFQKPAEENETPDSPREADAGPEKGRRRPPRPAPPKGKNAPAKNGRKKKKHKTDDERRGFIKSLVIIVLCGVLFLTVALMVVSNFVSHPLLALPRKMVTSVITPVQTFFSGVTDSVVSYLRTLKIRGSLEYEYEQLTLLLDDYANEIAQNEELRRINQSLYDLLDEQERNRQMDPVAATVIGTDSGNYFSTLTLDVGSASGVKEYMAVVAQGGLVGVTYDVEKNKCQVRTIINSDCTVAALVQSSRDQGSVKGTLGVNGEAMCRMYYLPDNSLPRPGDTVVTSGVGLEFPKGIPIGYIRESTRGMEDNKSYVVLEPVVDFQHLEYVTVYRYKPAYAEAAQARVSTDVESLELLSTPRPVPTWSVGSVSDFIFTATETPAPTPEGQTPAPTATPTPTPRVTATPDPNATKRPDNLEYQPADNSDVTPSPSPRPTFTPTPSPSPTPDPGGMTVEEEE